MLEPLGDYKRAVVLTAIRKSLEAPDIRQWRISRYGREVFTDWGDVYHIEDDGSLTLTQRAVPRPCSAK